MKDNKARQDIKKISKDIVRLKESQLEIVKKKCPARKRITPNIKSNWYIYICMVCGTQFTIEQKEHARILKED